MNRSTREALYFQGSKDVTVMKIIILLTTACLVAGCVNLHGKLIATDGANEIYQINLRSSHEKTILYKTRGIIGKITKVDDRSFIFDEFKWRKDPVIKQYDLDSGEVKTLGQGFEPTYLGGPDQIVFYRQVHESEEGHVNEYSGWNCWLVAADVGNLDRFVKIMPIKDHKPPVIQISPHQAIFYAGYNHVSIYDNLLKAKIERVNTPEKDCRPVLWRGRTQEVLFVRDGNYGVLMALESNSKEKRLFQLGVVRDAVYLPEDDAMIYVRTVWPETGDTYWYSFDRNRKKKIRTGGHRSAIWIP